MTRTARIWGGVIAAALTACIFFGCSMSEDSLATIGLTNSSGSGGGGTAGWLTGTLTASTQSLIYRFYADSYTSYYIYWDDSYQGSGNTTVDVKVSASTSASFSSTLFYEVDSGYTSGRRVYQSSSGYIYLKVVPYSSGDSGTFRICVKNSSGNFVTISAYSPSNTTTSLAGTTWYLCYVTSGYDSSYDFIEIEDWSGENLQFIDNMLYWNKRSGGTQYDTYTYAQNGSTYTLSDGSTFEVLYNTSTRLILDFSDGLCRYYTSTAN